jgi:PAS domain S-box-containing protein
MQVAAEAQIFTPPLSLVAIGVPILDRRLRVLNKTNTTADSVSFENEPPLDLIAEPLLCQTPHGSQVLCRTLVDSLTDHAVFAISPSGEIISWNAGAEKTFGYCAAEVMGQPFDVIFTAEDAKAGAPQHELAIALSGQTSQHDRWHVRKDGSRFLGNQYDQPVVRPVGRAPRVHNSREGQHRQPSRDRKAQ